MHTFTSAVRTQAAPLSGGKQAARASRVPRLLANVRTLFDERHVRLHVGQLRELQRRGGAAHSNSRREQLSKG